MSNEVAVHEIGNEKMELIKQTVAKGTTDLEFNLFLHACKRTGLDPLMKQIYAIKRLNRKTNKEEMSIQTGIDGYRLIADRTGGYAGSDEPTYIIAEDKLPDVASVTVYKLVGGIRCPFSSSARWAEYYSDSSPMWKKMPFLMLGKCAEALALRKAFPAELSGVYTHEEMNQADNEPQAAHQPFKLNAPPQPPAQAPKSSPEPNAAQEGVFVWTIGKTPDQGGHKGKPIDTINLDYLEWYVANGKLADHVAAAKAELARVDRLEAANLEQQPNISALCEAYLENISVSETVSECQKAMESALSDENINVFEQTHLKDTAERKLALLRG